MADIVKKDSGEFTRAEWDPFRVMKEMLRWDPFRATTPAYFEKPMFYPSFEVTENKEGYVFKADVPGVKKEDIEITTTANRLQISGKREYEEEKKNDTVYTWERQYGTFTRTFTLPDGVDLEHAMSELKDGVLTLVIPKMAAALPKKITISGGAPKS